MDMELALALDAAYKKYRRAYEYLDFAVSDASDATPAELCAAEDAVNAAWKAYKKLKTDFATCQLTHGDHCKHPIARY